MVMTVPAATSSVAVQVQVSPPLAKLVPFHAPALKLITVPAAMSVKAANCSVSAESGVSRLKPVKAIEPAVRSVAMTNSFRNLGKQKRGFASEAVRRLICEMQPDRNQAAENSAG